MNTHPLYQMVLIRQSYLCISSAWRLSQWCTTRSMCHWLEGSVKTLDWDVGCRAAQYCQPFFSTVPKTGGEYWLLYCLSGRSRSSTAGDTLIGRSWRAHSSKNSSMELHKCTISRNILLFCWRMTSMGQRRPYQNTLIDHDCQAPNGPLIIPPVLSAIKQCLPIHWHEPIQLMFFCLFVKGADLLSGRALLSNLTLYHI
jgi:hypothetical protein